MGRGHARSKGASDTNLAAMAWEDFEHLVRELLEKEFGEGDAEVRITQASRDRGVDAVIFDPDPLLGRQDCRANEVVYECRGLRALREISTRLHDVVGVMFGAWISKRSEGNTSLFLRF